jgi:hypothetical protein
LEGFEKKPPTARNRTAGVWCSDDLRTRNRLRTNGLVDNCAAQEGYGAAAADYPAVEYPVQVEAEMGSQELPTQDISYMR